MTIARNLMAELQQVVDDHLTRFRLEEATSALEEARTALHGRQGAVVKNCMRYWVMTWNRRRRQGLRCQEVVLVACGTSTLGVLAGRI